MPKESERSPEKYFLDPKTGADRRIIDANRFIYEGVSETINAEAQKAAMRAARNPMPDDHGQMAVFSDEEIGCHGSQWQIYGPRMRYYGNYGSRVALNRSGLSWDHYLLSDLNHPDRPDYKLNIFLTAGTITPERIQWVQENLQRDGNVVIFINNAGYSLGDGFEKNIRALTGVSYPRIMKIHKIFG